MSLRVAVFVGVLCCAWARLSPAQTPIAPAPTSQWNWHPSVFVLASGDENDDPPVGSVPVNFEEAEFAGNVGGGLAGGLASERTRVAVDLFGLARSPLSGSMRSVYVGGRVNVSWQPASAWSLQLNDSAKLQRQPQFAPAGFQRNDAVFGVNWRRPEAPLGLSLEVGDRRRELPALEVLGFARQSFTASATASNGTSASEIGISVQPYQASTAEGRRLVFSAEVARFGHGMIASARYALAQPWVDHSRVYGGDEKSDGGEFGNIDRAEFLEQLSLDGSGSTIASEALALDPVETDSDDWDFGRRKHVVLGYLSRTFAHNTVLSGSVRYQRRDGPNLLVPDDEGPAASFRDSRLSVRATFRRQLSSRLTAVAQVSSLRNRSDRAVADFSRQLVGVGLQIRLGSAR